MRRVTPALLLVLGAVAWPAAAARASAQGQGPGPATRPARIRPEARADLVVAGHGALQLGAGAAVEAGPYVRLALLAGVGHSLGSDPGVVGRVDALARFVLDPFAESRFGLYGFGGLGAMFDRRKGEPRVVVGLGIEGPVARGRTGALEVGLGGGLRVGLASRWRARGRR